MNERIIELATTLWEYHKFTKSTTKADVIIGLVSYDIQTAVHCCELYYKKVADKIVFTGKSGNWTEGRWDKTEAEVFAEKAIELGVPESAIIIEPNAKNIGDNIELSLMKLSKISSAVLVTKPNTLRRAIATAEIKNDKIEWFTSCIERELTEPVTFNHTLEDLINEMVGDIQRMIEYPAKGFQKEQSMPGKVKVAYNELKALGFNKHCF